MSSGRYGGWRLERAGWVWGLTGGQAAAVLVAGLLPLLGLDGGHYRALLAELPAAVVIVALTVWRPFGRPAAAWVVALLVWWMGDAMRWSRFQSASAAGAAATVSDRPDLPGALARLRFHDGEPLVGHGRVALVEDPAENTWTAVALATHPGLGLASGDLQAHRVDGWGRVLAAIATEGGMIRRLSVMVRTVPDDGTEAAAWTAKHLDASAPAGPLRTIAELSEAAAPTAVRQEIYLTATVDGDKARRALREAGGGVAGWSRLMHRELATLGAPLADAGFATVEWLDTASLAEAVRGGFDPQAVAALHAHRLEADTPGWAGPPPGLPMSLAGPAAAVNRRGVYLHDGASTVSYAVLLPSLPVTVGLLAPLLHPAGPGERRSVALHFEPLPPSRANRAVQGDVNRAELAVELKRAKGFRISKKDERAVVDAHVQDAQLAAGHGLVRLAVVFGVTTSTPDAIEDVAALAEGAARGARLRLRRLWLAQDAGFFAAVLPLGIGLRRLRSVW